MKRRFGALELGAYGLASLGEGLGYNLFYSYYLYFITTFAGIDGAAAGFLSLFSVTVGALADFIVGRRSDRARARGVRRTTYMLAGAAPMGACLALLFLAPELSTGGKLAYYLAANIGFWLCLSVADIPYISLGAELTPDSETKTGLRSAATLFLNFSGLIVGSGIFPLVMLLTPRTGGEGRAWGVVGILAGAAAAGAFILSALFYRRRERPSWNGAAQDKVGDVLRRLVRIRAFPLVIAVALAVNVLVGIVSSAGVFLYTGSYGLSVPLYALTMLAGTGAFVLAVIPIGTLVTCVGNQAALAVCMALGAGSAVLRWVLPRDVISAVVTTILHNVALAGFWTVIYLLLYQVMDVNELRNRRRDEATTVSLLALTTKVGGSVGVWLFGVGGILEDPEAVFAFCVWTSLAVFLLCLALVICYPYGKKRSAAMEAVLAGRRNGETGGERP